MTFVKGKETKEKLMEIHTGGVGRQAALRGNRFSFKLETLLGAQTRGVIWGSG